MVAGVEDPLLSVVRNATLALGHDDPSLPSGLETYLWITNPDGTVGGPDDDLLAPLYRSLLADGEGVALFRRHPEDGLAGQGVRASCGALPSFWLGASGARGTYEVALVGVDDLVLAREQERDGRPTTPVWLWAPDLAWVLHWWPTEHYAGLAGPRDLLNRVRASIEAAVAVGPDDEPLVQEMTHHP